MNDKKFWLKKNAVAFFFSALVFSLMMLNATHPYIGNGVNFTYSDGFYIASVANNIVNGHGFSYWDGFSYQKMDPEITSGPVVIYPLALALLFGVDKGVAYYWSPLAVNSMCLFFLMACIFRYFSIVRCLFFGASLSIFFVSFQFWQWYLPLGEVPCLLLGFLSFFIFGVAESRWLLFVSGFVWSLAVLSKLMFILTAPVIVFLAFIFFGRRFDFVYWVFGCFFAFILFLLSLMMTFDSYSLWFIGDLLSGYFKYSFWYVFNLSFDSVVFGRGGAYASFVGMFLDNVRLIDVFGTFWSYFQVIFLAIVYLVCASMVALCKKDNVLYKSFLGLFLSSSVFVFWYFFGGSHYDRYFFIPFGFVYAMFCLFFSSFSKKIIMYFIGAISPCFYYVFNNGFAGIFEDNWYRFFLYDSKKISEYIYRDDSANGFLAGSTVFSPYASVGYFLGGNSFYYSVYAYVDRNARVLDLSLCKKDFTLGDMSSSIGSRTSLSYACSKKKDSKIIMEWKDGFIGGSYLVVWSDLYPPEMAAYKHCSSILYHGDYYRLYWCSRDEMSKIVFDESGQHISIK